MNTRIRIAIAVGLLTATCLGGTPVLAETGQCPKVTAVERIDGTVMNVDLDQGILTLLGSDGTIHKFQASRETLQDLKIGEKIETKLRISEKCRKG